MSKKRKHTDIIKDISSGNQHKVRKLDSSHGTHNIVIQNKFSKPQKLKKLDAKTVTIKTSKDTCPSKASTKHSSVLLKLNKLGEDEAGQGIQKSRKQGSCMKHKKKDKTVHKKKEGKSKKPKPAEESSVTQTPASQSTVQKSIVPFRLPNTSQEVSSNWKQLQQTLQFSSKKKSSHSKNSTTNLMKKSSKTEKSSSKQQKIDDTSDKAKQEPEIWFDDVDEVLLESSKPKAPDASTLTKDWDSKHNPLVKPDSFQGLTKIIAMDCEMVGVGPEGSDSVLARVSIVNQYGMCVYDKLVASPEPVTDYRTQYSGIHQGDLTNAEEFSKVQREVHEALKGRILVGHALHNDMKVLMLDHPRRQIRDTSQYKPFRQLFQGRRPALRKLADQVLGVTVQQGEHSSIQDAQAAMRLYTMYRKNWERELKLRKELHKRKQKDKSSGDLDSSGILSDS